MSDITPIPVFSLVPACICNCAFKNKTLLLLLRCFDLDDFLCI